jgi:hypothetical protein
MSSSVSRLILLYASVVGLVTSASEVVCIFSPSFNLYIHLQILPDVTMGLMGCVAYVFYSLEEFVV